MILYKDIPSYLQATCRNCGTTTEYNNYIRYRLEPDQVVLAIEFQCNECGKTKAFTGYTSDFYGTAKEKCSCDGLFRRDQPLFCPCCKYNKVVI